MSGVVRNSSIMLFGKNIAPPDEVVSEQRQSSSATSVSSSSDTKDTSGVVFIETKDAYNSMDSTEETLTEETTSCATEKDSLSQTKSNEEESIESDLSQEKMALKKPDEIVPCPRCISKDTKFCYYNNNNLNQPRHFCKNCQRYWTNGGIMRNLPIGSGRRKTKIVPTIPNHPHIMAYEEAVNGIQVAPLEPNGFFLFGSDGSLDQSKTSEHASKYGSIVFYPTTSYWGCALPQPWVPPTLGKRSREESIVSPSNSGNESLVEKTNPKRSVLIPKTLRFDDPIEAAKSSIWSALGIKNDGIASINRTSLFKAYEAKGVTVRNNNIDSAMMVLQANPAALSRSFSFRETA